MGKPNIIFVLLDGARWDRTSISPDFLELQKKGTLFNNVTTAIPYTAGALNVIFSGLFGKENGVNGYYKILELKDSVKILPEILKQEGYFTSRGLINDQLLSPRGYDIRRSYDEFTEDLNLRHPELLKETFKKANGKPVFSLLQFTRIHTVTVSKVLRKYKWDDQRFYDRKKQNLEKFDEAFEEACVYAKKINKIIEDLGKSNETILIFFTDHGTGIGERFGERNYGSFAYEETLRTFYLFSGPGIVKNRVCEKLISTVDIFPTILDLCEINIELERPGKSFAPYLLGIKEAMVDEPFTFSETGALHGPFPSPEESNLFCVKTPRYKLIYLKTANRWELFDLIKDSLEKNNIFGKGLEEIENKLKEKLLEWINR